MAPTSTAATISTSALPFGTDSAYADNFLPQPTVVDFTRSDCYRLTLFKDTLKQFRKLDDTVTLRLQRANAQSRDDSRRLGHRPSSEDEEASCLVFWRQMIQSWESRRSLIQFCTTELTTNLTRRTEALKGVDPRLDKRGGRERGDLFELEVLRNQIANEQFVEAIIRRRTLDAFKSRCKFFQPPNDPDGRSKVWWDAVELGGRSGSGTNGGRSG